MPKKVRYLLERDGRYFARLVVPKELRPFLENRTELRTPLGSDYRAAVKAIHGAVADLQLRIRNAEILAGVIASRRSAETSVTPIGSLTRSAVMPGEPQEMTMAT